MNQWLEELMADVVKWDGRYHDGPHCGHCHRNHDCPAVTAMIRRDVAMFHEGATHDVQAMDAPTFCGYFRTLKTLEALVKEAREHARIEVERRGGSVEDGAGSVIHFIETNAAREVDFLKAKPIIDGLLSPEDSAEAIMVSAKKLEDIVAAKAGRGNGAGAKRELAAALTAAGAINQPKTRKLIEERIK
jgi:hypothetical protein